MFRVRNQSRVRAVDEQVCLLQDGLADEDFIAQDQALFHGVTPEEFDSDRVGHGNGFRASVGVLDNALPGELQIEEFRHVPGQDRANRTCVYDGIRFVRADLVGRKLSASGKGRVDHIRESSLHTNLAHRPVPPILPHALR